VEAKYLPATRAVELLFPPIDPVVADFPLASGGYGGLFCIGFSPFSFVRQ